MVDVTIKLGTAHGAELHGARPRQLSEYGVLNEAGIMDKSSQEDLFLSPYDGLGLSLPNAKTGFSTAQKAAMHSAMWRMSLVLPQMRFFSYAEVQDQPGVQANNEEHPCRVIGISSYHALIYLLVITINNSSCDETR